MKSEAIVSQKIFEEQNQKLADLEAELAKEKEAHLTTMQINEALQIKIEELETTGKKAVKAKVVKVPDTAFKVGKVDYIFTVPALSYKGRKITAEQALQDKDLLQFLVDEKSSLVKRKNA